MLSCDFLLQTTVSCHASTDESVYLESVWQLWVNSLALLPQFANCTGEEKLRWT